MIDEQMIAAPEAKQSMFVQTAQGVSSNGRTLTLTGVNPSPLYFSDRPKRVVGHTGTADPVGVWGGGEYSSEEDPPNAVLAFLEPGDDVPEDAVMVILQPRMQDGQLTYATAGDSRSAPSRL